MTVAPTGDDPSSSSSDATPVEQEQVIDANASTNEMDPNDLARDLTDQPWHEIGHCPRPIGATADFDTMIDQLTAVLSFRLVDVVLARVGSSSGSGGGEGAGSDAEEFLAPIEEPQQQHPEKQRESTSDDDDNNSDRGSDDGGGGDNDALIKVAAASSAGGRRSSSTASSSSSRGSAAQQRRRRRRSLTPALQSNLRSYVAAIGRMYNDVPFHSLEHAAHVTVSMNKLIAMLLQPEDVGPGHGGGYDSDCASDHGSHHGPGHQGRHNRRQTIQHVVPGSGVAVVRPPSPELCHLDCGDDAGSTAEGRYIAEEATYGIGSDAHIKFALVFAALIHDVGHRGVPNATLIDEEDDLAILHNDVSVAEQNSLSIAFTLLLKEEFGLLKRCVMPDKEARKAFRKRVIDIVLSTDISSPERMQVTKSRWREAFESVTPDVIEVGSQVGGIDGTDGIDNGGGDYGRRLSNDSTAGGTSRARRHTMHCSSLKTMRSLQAARMIGMRHSLQLGGKLIDVYSDNDSDGHVGSKMLRRHAVLDAITNVADVAHTMQAFHVFVKWNRRLYEELLAAYHRGRIGWDPTVGWHENQINFFDAYILPLAEKMDASGVFGSKSSVFLYFATENKRRWGVEGDKITEEMVDEIGRKMLAGMVEEASASASTAAVTAGGDAASSAEGGGGGGTS